MTTVGKECFNFPYFNFCKAFILLFGFYKEKMGGKKQEKIEGEKKRER